MTKFLLIALSCILLLGVGVTYAVDVIAEHQVYHTKKAKQMADDAAATCRQSFITCTYPNGERTTIQNKLDHLLVDGKYKVFDVTDYPDDDWGDPIWTYENKGYIYKLDSEDQRYYVVTNKRTGATRKAWCR